MFGSIRKWWEDRQEFKAGVRRAAKFGNAMDRTTSHLDEQRLKSIVKLASVLDTQQENNREMLLVLHEIKRTLPQVVQNTELMAQYLLELKNDRAS